ncbi:Serpin domain-containing protein [Artemisia annua]|uniref:Serpin domain-containing protein n=1 Tax=Artemisia annua TaxID=35608 RepID=A0A2U1NQJ8_ARTAN|nr:Serpin domain-containing protein [Artemisia annua]
MADKGRIKRTVSGDEPHILSEKKKKLTPTDTVSANSTTIVTKTLLDDAHNGFKNGNFVCSPFSLEIILGMLAAGAEGETLKQLLEFLGHESIDELLTKSPTKILSGSAGDVDFTLANGVWVDKKVEPVRSCYQWVLKTIYKAKATYVDFENQEKRNEVVKEINSWVRKETKGLIPKIAEKSDFNEDDLVVFVNALYFKGAWYQPFIPCLTRNYYFHLINGKKVSVPFMTQYRRLGYGCFKDYKMIQLPYKSGDQLSEFSMYIFLPHEKDGLQSLLEHFHSDDALFRGDFDLKWTTFDALLIPKFKISCTFKPQDVMQLMGLTLPFKSTNKELSGIVGMKGLYDDMLYVSKILQKSFIEVDEEGTEATVVTSLGLSGGGPGPPPKPKPVFVADHPFMFMIREDTSKAVLFVGAVLNPLT